MDATRHPMPPAGKLLGIQALRGMAAIAVILYHVARHLDQVVPSAAMMRLFQPGHAGVDLFFVLSGFIILHVHRGDIGRPGRLRHYGRQRFQRLMPIYWIALALTALGVAAGGHGSVAPGALAWSASLLPTRGEPLLGIAWTLQHELLFYLAFALLILNWRLGVAVMLLWLGWIAVAFALPLEGWGPPRLSSFYNLEFLFGMGAAALLASGRVRAPRLLAGAGIGLLAAAGVVESLALLDGYGDAARLAYGLPSAMLICGLAAWEKEGNLPVPAALAALGEASYSLYLFQFLGLGVAWQLWTRLGLDTWTLLPLCFLVLTAAAVTAGIVMSRLVEQPLLARMRRLGRPGYSCRSASMGLSAAARRAGK
ncbi:MAG: acyltransferase [Sphingobium sp.]|nr:acyltransferase [Sphingobium sp.]